MAATGRPLFVWPSVRGRCGPQTATAPAENRGAPRPPMRDGSRCSLKQDSSRPLSELNAATRAVRLLQKKAFSRRPAIEVGSW